MGLALLCLMIVTGQQQALAQIDAITTASYDLRMAFTVNGALAKVPVKAGDRVKAGDLLLALEDNEGLAMVLQYELKASSELAIESAEEQYRLAQVEARAIRQLLENKAATPIEMDRANVKAAIAALEVKHARQQLEEARHLLAQAKARHARYELYSPIDGVVDTLVARVGETVESLKPVIRLVNTQTLYVDASVPTSQTLSLKAGDPAWVTFRILQDKPPVQGRILHLATVADSASDTRIVRIETPNPYELPAGGTVSISFKPAASEASQGQAQSPAQSDGGQ
jgi:multidrug efflux system membrane fusion protein